MSHREEWAPKQQHKKGRTPAMAIGGWVGGWGVPFVEDESTDSCASRLMLMAAGPRRILDFHFAADDEQREEVRGSSPAAAFGLV